jgi:FkbM family methyltransferase
MSVPAAVERLLSRAAYWTMVHLPAPAIARLQAIAQENSATSRAMSRITRSIRSGERRIAGGPAQGMLIDLSGSRPSYLLGTTEPGVQEFIVEHLHEGGVFYDLGANVGYFTLVGARIVGSRGRVRAYEPFTENAAALRRNVALNGLTDTVTVVEAAVADHAGQAAFRTGPTGQDGRLSDEGELVVPMVTLDEEIGQGAAPPTFVKIDIEGAELAALRGMREALKTHRPVVLCEVHHPPHGLETNPVARLLAEASYDVRWLEGGVNDEEYFWTPHLAAVPSNDRA